MSKKILFQKKNTEDGISFDLLMNKKNKKIDVNYQRVASWA